MKTALLVIFFASAVVAQNPAQVPHAAACGPMNIRFQVTIDPGQTSPPEIETGKALIYVVEDQKFKAVNDVTARIGLDGSWVGATRGNSYLFFSVEPGEHHLCADWVSKLVPSGREVSLFGFTAEAGKTYYFRARTTGGPPSAMDRNGLGDMAAIDLDLINSDEGKLLVSSSPVSISHAKK